MSLFDTLRASSSIQSSAGQIRTEEPPTTKHKDKQPISLSSSTSSGGATGVPEHSATSQTGATTQTESVDNELDLGPADGLQLRFAKLLLKLSNSCKAQASEYMKQIEGIQQKQKEVAAMIAEARNMMNACGDSKTTTQPMSAELRAYFIKENLTLGTVTSVTGDGRSSFKKEQWEFNLKSLTNHQEQLGTKTQSLMVILQDFVGQYNANLTGAKTAVSDFTDTLKALMR